MPASTENTSAWQTLVETVRGLGESGVSAYTAFRDAELEATRIENARAGETPQPTPAWLIPALIGGGLLVVLLIFGLRK